MSLKYNGYVFNIGILGQNEAISEYAYPTVDPESDKKKAFLAAMAKFVESDDFEKFTNQMYNNFSINVQALVSTSTE